LERKRIRITIESNQAENSPQKELFDVDIDDDDEEEEEEDDCEGDDRR